MKLHPASTGTLNTVTAYGDRYVDVNGVRFDHPIVLAPERPIERWSVERFDALTAEAFASILALAPDVVLLGTGARQRFVHPRVLAPLAERRIGLEAMDTRAACRTYNILMVEGRKVVAALLFD